MELSRDERLAALMDGTCSEAEREELLAMLAGDDDELEVFAAAAAALNQHEREAREDGVIPLHKPVRATPARPRLRPPRWVGILAAAGLAALIVLPLAWPDVEAGGPREYVGRLSNPAAPLASLSGDPLAGATRGGPGAEMTPGEHVQLGARLVAVEFHSGRGDTTEMRTAAGKVADLLEGHVDPGGVRAQYRAIGAGRVAPGAIDASLAERAHQIAGSEDAIRLGEWVQTAVFAAAQHDSAFFDSKECRRRLAGKGSAEALLKPAAPQLRSVRAALARKPRDWPRVQAALDELLRHLAA